MGKKNSILKLTKTAKCWLYQLLKTLRFRRYSKLFQRSLHCKSQLKLPLSSKPSAIYSKLKRCSGRINVRSNVWFLMSYWNINGKKVCRVIVVTMIWSKNKDSEHYQRKRKEKKKRSRLKTTTVRLIRHLIKKEIVVCGPKMKWKFCRLPYNAMARVSAWLPKSWIIHELTSKYFKS